MRSADLTEWGARDREQMLERLNNLRAILPIFARELANARREAARLRVQNRRLTEQIEKCEARGTRMSQTLLSNLHTAWPIEQSRELAQLQVNQRRITMHAVVTRVSVQEAP